MIIQSKKSTHFRTSKMDFLSILVFCAITICVNGEFCPKQCDCDMQEELKRAVCENQNIISVDIGVPKYVQVYNLHNNAISELDNFCFMNVGYTSLKVIDVSYNHIFWIGLHAFSGLEELVHIDLSNNRLRSITPDLFWDTPLLEYLDLSGNIFESLKNEPFLMHNVLKILNLNNCRISAIPLRMFTRLPNLRKLDLSENYMIGLQIPALVPLKRLERLELRNEYWKCTPDFISVEIWIVSRGIYYGQQCNKKFPKMSEKMIAIDDPEVREDVDIDKVWNITRVVTPNVTASIKKTDDMLTIFERFDRDFPSLWALLMGLEIGFVLGMVGTYIWLRNLCKCGALSCTRPNTPRQQRRLQRMNDNELRVNLLWNTVLHSNIDTPPSHRRQLELPEGYPPRILSTAPSPTAASERSETPPPPYAECRVPWVFNA